MKDVDARLIDTDRCIDEMDRCGTDAAMLSLTSPGGQSILDRAAAVDFAKWTNDEIADHFTSRHPGRLHAFATVALQSPRDVADEIERAVVQCLLSSSLTFGGIRFVQPRQIDVVFTRRCRR
ncbi:amidohydrolase family protein [Burkholderia sp. AW33-5]